MIPWVLLDSAQVPGNGGEMRLYRRNDEYSIRLAGLRGELMNSRTHASEDALAERTCARLDNRVSPRLLIGGLGMGFTLAAALRHLGPQAEVWVAELVPAVVTWNRGPLAALAGHPLDDARVQVHAGDVAKPIRSEKAGYDAILLDVDNGPEGLTHKNNDFLYSMNGLTAAYTALRPRGVLAVWSASPDVRFFQRMRKVGFATDEMHVRAHGSKGSRRVIWLGTKH
jgi:spermidine synthase